MGWEDGGDNAVPGEARATDMTPGAKELGTAPESILASETWEITFFTGAVG